MPRLETQPEAAGAVPQVAAGDQQANVVVGQRAAYGARLPYPDEVLSSVDIAAILFPAHKHPTQAVWRWLRSNHVPTYTVGRQVRVTGASFLAALKDADKARRRSQIRRAS
jgi:hypothetical protein